MIYMYNIHFQLSTAIASTGLPNSGKLATQCVNATNWPGGDMYIRVDANAFTYVVYTLSVKLYFPTTNKEHHYIYKPSKVCSI